MTGAYLTGFLIGAVVGIIGGFFIYRNNQAELAARLDQAQSTIEDLRAKLRK